MTSCPNTSDNNPNFQRPLAIQELEIIAFEHFTEQRLPISQCINEHFCSATSWVPLGTLSALG